MSIDVTPSQALLLFGLLALHGECAQSALMPAVKKVDREALEKAKLISVKKVGRAFFFTLSDAGWDWAGANLSAELPPAYGVLHAMLVRLGSHLAKENKNLAWFIGSKTDEKVAAKLEQKRSTKLAKPKTSKSKPLSPVALRKRIETAYLSLTGGRRNESVRLARLRDALSDIDGAMVDAALGRILKGDKTASLMRHDDPGQLSSADHAAAFNPAGEPFHVIWIAS